MRRRKEGGKEKCGGAHKKPPSGLSRPPPPCCLSAGTCRDQRESHFLVAQECVSRERYLGPGEGGDPAPSLARGLPSPVKPTCHQAACPGREERRQSMWRLGAQAVARQLWFHRPECHSRTGGACCVCSHVCFFATPRTVARQAPLCLWLGQII